MQMLARVQRSYGKARLRTEAPTASASPVPSAPSHSPLRPPLGSASVTVSKDAATSTMTGPGQVLNFAARITLASDSTANHTAKPHLLSTMNLFPSFSVAHWPPCEMTFTNSNHDFMPPSATSANLSTKSALSTAPALTPLVTGQVTSLELSLTKASRPMTTEMKKREEAMLKERRYRADKKLRTKDPRELSSLEVLCYVQRELERWVESNEIVRDEEGFDEAVSWPGRWKEDYDYALYDE